MKNFLENIKNIPSTTMKALSFIAIILIYFVIFLIQFIFRKVLRLVTLEVRITNTLKRFAKIFDNSPKDTISRIDLVEMALENMKAKKSRAVITIGGMAIGIGLIVLLVSIGYGLQDLVTSRVASLQEMRQTEVSPQVGGTLKLTDDSINNFKQIPNVTKALPIISAVGHIDFQGSQSDIATYAVTTEYLKEAGLVITNGNMFESDILTSDVKGLTDDNGTLPQIDLSSETTEENSTIESVPISSDNAKFEIILNKASMELLGLKEDQIVGQKISASFIIISELLAEDSSKIQSAKAEFTVVGVSSDDSSPILYIPFIDLRSLGISNYSQIKVVVEDQDSLAQARAQIESSGYITDSVADTVAQIDSIFQTSRTVLGLFGFIALFVAAMGMFNTLTISLLERTREVGLMKAMGMKSSEVREVFVTESMTLGLWGGIIGLLGGYFAGTIIGLILSFFSIFNGQGMIDVTNLPFVFVLFIIMLSLTVGVLTGLFPARRATSISALNALRYE